MKWYLASLLLLITLCGCASTPQPPQDDVAFAQSAYTALFSGNPKAESMIGFDTFNMMSVDVGTPYRKMPSDTVRAQFRHRFLTGCASSFKNMGTTVKMLKNWRLVKSKPPRSIVAVDGKKGSLYLTVTQKDGVQKLTGISLTP